MSVREPTEGTEVAALEAKFNEQQVLAEGALIGERRVAWVRLAMVAAFGIVTNLRGRTAWPMTAAGAVYTVFTVVTLIVVHRIAAQRTRRWRPMAVATVDFTFITLQGLLANHYLGDYQPGMSAVSNALVLTFAVARYPTYQVVYSMVWAVVGFAAVAAYAGVLATATTLFIVGGLLVLGLMVLMTNLAVREMFSGLRKRDNLTRFLPRQVAQRVLEAGPTALAAVEREVTVMFSDIRGFTAMSEAMDPRQLLAMLDDYFGRMSQIVKGHDGVVGKFLGDGLLAFWGVPDRLDDHANRAVRAARDMRRALRELNEQRTADGLAPIRIGIGIHTGTVAAGMLGGTLQSEYTVIGDAVNVASRVEGLTKEHATDVLVSETTWAQLPEPRRGQRVASAEIRGRKEPVVLYTIDGSPATVEVMAVPDSSR